ncbi:hypothetical protein OHS18_27660 [Amycolatopsis sp. NBC_00355]|uniref:hypothetical protein n=1 Tax=Amycolatopsis sp. NBC_00355 TaxID=2975957 RepID=UPI002E257AC1
MLGFAVLAAIVRLSTIAQALLFLRWLIKTGKGDPQVLRLALPILKALPALLREDRRWVAALRQLFRRSEKTGDEDSSQGGGKAR